MFVHHESNSLLLRLRNPNVVRTVLPKMSKDIDIDGHNVAVKYDLDVVRVLRNLGIKAPSPIRHNYSWPRPARFARVFDHQVITAEFLTLHSRAFVLNEMGTSKTSSALWAADYLMNIGAVGKCLIVSPLSTLELVWASEIFDVLMHRSCVVLHGTREKRLDLLNSDADFYIINHDGLKIIAQDLIRRRDINLIIIDEAAAYRNGTTERYKLLKRTLQPWHRLWLMTGTPCPNAPTDAWALARLVNPSNVPQYFKQWQRQTMYEVSAYKWAAKPEAYEMAFRAMQPAVRFKKSECLDLPPVTFENRKVDVTKEQADLFRQMKREYAAEVAAGVPIMAVNAADKITKLRQILCGVIKDPATETYHTIPHQPRVDALIEAIEQASAKVLIIVPFKGIIYDLQKDLASKYNFGVVNGDLSMKQRTAAFQQFKTDPNMKGLLCHPKVMAHGITATEADMLIFYAPIYSNEESQQVMDRINRPGQTRKMTIVRLGASSLEWSIYDAVEGKKLNQDTILDMYRKEVLDI